MARHPHRTIGLLTLGLWAGSLQGCAPRALVAPVAPTNQPVGEVRLVLGSLESRSVQWAVPATKARIRVDGPGMAQPVAVTADLNSEATASVVVSGLSAGPNRIVTLERLDAAGGVIPGGTLKTTVDVVAGTTSQATIGKITTPRGGVLEQVLAGDRAQETNLAASLDQAALQALVEEVIKQGATYPDLVDARAIATDVRIAKAVPTTWETRYILYPATLDLTLEGIPSPAPADVWLDDPLSPKNVSLYGGTHRLTPVAPGTWVLHVRSAGMGVEATRSVTLASNQSATASVSLGAPPEQIQAAMPKAGMASAFGVLSLDGKDWLLSAGGIQRATDSVYYHNQLWAYDGSTWTTQSALPAEGVAAYAHGATLDNRLYVAGGIRPGASGAELLGDVFRFDGTDWSSLPALPSPRGSAAVAALGSRLYVVGGFKNAGWGPFGSYPDDASDRTRDYSGEFNATESFRFDPIANTWTTMPSGLVTPRGDMAAAVLNGRIYVFGGQTFTDYAGSYVQFPSPAVESADETGAWRMETAMPTARGGAAAVVANNRIYVIGGCTIGGIPLGSVEVFDPATGRWTIKPPLRRARGYVTAGLLNGRIVVAGGGDGGSAGLEGVPQDTVESFVP